MGREIETPKYPTPNKVQFLIFIFFKQKVPVLEFECVGIPGHCGGF